MEGYRGAFGACVPRPAHIPDSTIQGKPATTVLTVLHCREQLMLYLPISDVDALIFAHCFAQPMHTMGECVSASFSNRYNLVLCYLSLQLQTTVYI
jgi:hypothetical protein